MAPNDDLPWNTTRCNRLLRPLSSKLAKLRKELDRQHNAPTNRRHSAHSVQCKASSHESHKSLQPARRSRLPERVRDPDWMPSGGPGTSKKTYGGRGTKKCTEMVRYGPDPDRSARPGQIMFTPLIARTAGRLEESPQVSGSPLKRFAKHRGRLIARVEQLQELNKQMPAEIGNLVKGLSEAYANLLQATALREEKKWKGTRSLFSACLRKMPEYIKLEEHFAELDKEEDEDDEDRDISQELYTYLEDQFETMPGQGWRSFKQMVRAHGTSLLCDAFADQILGLETLHLLVSHCLNASAWAEAEQLLRSFLPCLKPRTMPSHLLANLFDEHRSLYLWMTKDFVRRTGRHRFLFDQLEYMISQELLPLEWLATECMRPVWDRLVRSLSDGDDRCKGSAFRFLQTAILAGVGLPDESQFEDGEVEIVERQFKPSSRQEFRTALDTTFSSVLTVLSSIALVNANREDPVGQSIAQRITWALDTVVVDLLKRKNIRDDLMLLSPIAEHMETFAQRALWVAFASFLVHLDGCGPGSGVISLDVTSTVGAINWIASQYSSAHVDIATALTTLPEFTSSTAQGTGRIWKDDGYDQIQRLVNAMLSLSGLRLPHKLWTFKRLALESIMEFAHGTGDPRHMTYARKVENSMRTKGHVVIFHSPQKNESPLGAGGFRWEEGIGEWVACTPFVRQEAKRLSRKPVRALALLPTPEPSQDSTSEVDEPLIERGMPTPTCEESFHCDDNEDVCPQSSPVKKGPRTSTSSLGKRIRASSPIVLVTSKRCRICPVEIPVTILGGETQETCERGRRRSRRTRKEISAVISGLRVQRSRSSLSNRLQCLQRKAYHEAEDIEADLRDSESEQSPISDASRSPSSSEESQVAKRHLRRIRSPSRRRTSRRNVDTHNAYDSDELAKTPATKRRRSGRRVQSVQQWWIVDSGMTAGEESEDELSFQ